jgi:DNA (cytosine-5)-methyltransferase 1
MMRDGVVYELPMQVRPITDSESLLLRSPKASEGSGGAIGEAEALKRGNTVGVRDQVMDLVAGQGLKVSRVSDNLLPTVTVQDGKNTAGKSQFERNTLPLNAQVTLLPTVQVDDAKNTGHNQERRSTLASEVWLAENTTNWGKFEPAIKRWEELTRPAPAPTKPDGKDDAHRLSAEFTEWMMGLPQGWVTAPEIGLKRNDQLKACGNGVVPQQAELALRILLQGLQIESGGGS